MLLCIQGQANRVLSWMYGQQQYVSQVEKHGLCTAATATERSLFSKELTLLRRNVWPVRKVVRTALRWSSE